jgi:hypothetical protein
LWVTSNGNRRGNGNGNRLGNGNGSGNPNSIRSTGNGANESSLPRTREGS